MSYAHIRPRAIPVIGAGRHLRFDKAAINEWLRMTGSALPDHATAPGGELEPVRRRQIRTSTRTRPKTFAPRSEPQRA